MATGTTRRPLTKAERKAIGERMRRYHAARRETKAGGAVALPTTPVNGTTTANTTLLIALPAGFSIRQSSGGVQLEVPREAGATLVHDIVAKL
jgi:hypothetical protein